MMSNNENNCTKSMQVKVGPMMMPYDAIVIGPKPHCGTWQFLLFKQPMLIQHKSHDGYIMFPQYRSHCTWTYQVPTA